MLSSKTNEAEALLDRAIELLMAPTLANLRALESVLREAVARMPEHAGEGMRRKVRLCAKLLDSAERMRPGGDAAALEYAPRQSALTRGRAGQFRLEA